MNVDMLCDALLDYDDAAQENAKLRAEIERLRVELVQMDRARGMDTLDWLQIKGERDALRDQVEHEGCACAHLGERTYECGTPPCGLCRLRNERDALRAALDATTQATSCHSCVRGDGTDVIAEMTAERDALRATYDVDMERCADAMLALTNERGTRRAGLDWIRASTGALAVALRELKERRNNWAASLAQLQAKGGDQGGDFVTASYERTIAEVDEAIAAVKKLKEGV